MTTFINPYTYIPDPTRGRPVFNGQVFFGTPDTDPVQPGNRITVSVVNENGTLTPLSQPISTGPGGVAMFNGRPVQLDIVLVQYSMTILNAQGVLVYYSPRIAITDDSPAISDLLSQFSQFGTPRFITPSNNPNIPGSPFRYKTGARVVFNPGTGDRVYESLTNTNTTLPTDTAMWRQVDTTGTDLSNDARYLNSSNNLSDVTSAITSRTNIGLGEAATRNVGVNNGNLTEINNTTFFLDPTRRAVFPNGFYMQWGFVNSGSGEAGQTIVFPTSFPTDCLSVFVFPYPRTESSGNDWFVQLISFHRNLFRFFWQATGGSSNLRMTYFAIGN